MIPRFSLLGTRRPTLASLGVAIRLSALMLVFSSIAAAIYRLAVRTSQSAAPRRGGLLGTDLLADSIERPHRRRQALFPLTSVLISVLATLQELVRSRAACTSRCWPCVGGSCVRAHADPVFSRDRRTLRSARRYNAASARGHMLPGDFSAARGWRTPLSPHVTMCLRICRPSSIDTGAILAPSRFVSRPRALWCRRVPRRAVL